MTITLAAVYAPIGFQGGLTGSLFREFAFTLAGAVLDLRRRRADALAGDVVAAAAPGRRRARLRGLRQPRVRPAAERATRGVLDATLETAAGGLRRCGIVLRCWCSRSSCSRPRSSRRPRTRASSSASSQAAANATLDQTELLRRRGRRASRALPGDGVHVPAHLPHRRLRRHRWSKPWDERKRTALQILPEVHGASSRRSPASA